MYNNKITMEGAVAPVFSLAFYAPSQLTPLFLARQDMYSSTTEGKGLLLLISAAEGRGKAELNERDFSAIGWGLSKSPLSFACRVVVELTAAMSTLLVA